MHTYPMYIVKRCKSTQIILKAKEGGKKAQEKILGRL